MPELPEVETVLRTLEHLISGERIIDVSVFWDNIVVGDVEEFKQRLINESFREFKRRGKYLLFELDTITLVSHLRMEGRYYFYKEKINPSKHTHVVFDFASGNQLHYVDTRKFGKMELVSKSDVYQIEGLSYEPWDMRFNPSYVKKFLHRTKRPIKAVLLDQNFVAGIGNIYADEILFRTKIHPEKPANRISNTKIPQLIQNIRSILEEAIKQGGTTIRTYTSSLGVTGLFQQQLKVHQRKGETCLCCGGTIQKIKVMTRGTYFCPRCQK